MLRILNQANLAIPLIRTQSRSIGLSAVVALKKIVRNEDKSKKEITIQGEYIDPVESFGNKLLKFGSGTPDLVTKSEEVKPCAFCELEKRGVFVQHYDTLVLRQFLREDGFPLPRKITGLCKKQQRKLLVLLKHARMAGLTLSYQPTLLDGTKASEDPRKRPEHLKWNTYFDDYERMKKTNKYL